MMTMTQLHMAVVLVPATSIVAATPLPVALRGVCLVEQRLLTHLMQPSRGSRH